MGREMATSSGLSCGGLDAIAERLSGFPELYLPHSLCADRTLTLQEKKDHLLALVHRDPAIFLERYGGELELYELTEFDALSGEYEVNWHLRQLRAALNPSLEQQKSRAAAVKNRRLAFMEQLVEDGQYFTEEAMRMRCPLLHHEYVGQFQDPSTWSNFQRRGDKLADVIIRQSEELLVQRKLEEERQKASEVEEDEEDEEEDEDEEQKEKKQQEASYTEELNSFSCMQLSDARADPAETADNVEVREKARGVHEQVMSMSKVGGGRDERLEKFSREMMDKFLAEDGDDPKHREQEIELESKLEDFTRVMQERFLRGEDTEHFDYSSIDQDAALDDHWLREVSCEAEEKYFED